MLVDFRVHFSVEKSVFDILLWGVGGPHFAGVIITGRELNQSVTGETWRYIWSEHRPGI